MFNRLLAVALVVIAVCAVGASAQAAAPSNDDLANVVTLSGATGSTTGSDAEASFETNEVSSTHTFGTDGNVWYKWTAPFSGFVAFRTTDPNAPSSLDTVLSADAGTDITNLTEVRVNDDYPSCCTSRIVFQATAGETYNISVGAFPGDTFGQHAGDFGLEWGASDYYDADTPVITIAGLTTAKNTFSVSFGTGDATGNIVGASWLTTDCQIDGGPFSPCTSPFNPTVAGGTHTFAVRVTDGAGHVATKTGSVKVKGGRKPV